MSTTQKRGPGRPKLETGRAMGRIFAMRLTPDERTVIEQAADAAGQSTSEWARDILLAAAKAKN